MSDDPVLFSDWRGQYPTKGVLYNWTRPGETRKQMERAGVIKRVNNRWIFNPARWREYCASGMPKY
jgi:hypothetical protein